MPPPMASLIWTCDLLENSRGTDLEWVWNGSDLGQTLTPITYNFQNSERRLKSKDAEPPA